MSQIAFPLRWACFALLCFAGSSSPVLWAQETTAAQGDGAVAVYNFTTGSVNELLVLGPVPRDQKISDPSEVLKNPVEGAEVVLENGDRHRWQIFKPGGGGVFKFGQFCKAMKQGSGDVVVYGALRFETRGAPRWMYLGADDGVRLWLDGELRVDDTGPGFFHRREHTVAIPSDSDEQPLGIFEFTNYQGGFLGQISGGYVLQLEMLAQDEVTVESNTPVAVTVEGLTTRLRTNRYGRAELVVPYAQRLEIQFADGSTQFVESDEPQVVEGEPNTRSISLVVPRTIALRDESLQGLIPPGQFTAVVEKPDGLVLLANDSDKSVYCYKGSQFFKHPDQRLRNFTKGDINHLAVSQSGDLWITTNDDGVFRYDGQLLEHWAAGQLNEMVQAICVDDTGTAWVAVSNRDPEGVTKLVRLAQGKQPEPVDLEWPAGNSISGILQTLDGQMVVAGGNRLVWLEDTDHPVLLSLQGEHDLHNPTIAQAADGGIWLAGAELLEYRPETGLVRRGWLDGDVNGRNQQVVASQDGSVWGFCNSTVYRFSGDDFSTIQRLDLPFSNAFRSGISASTTGSLLVVGESIGLAEVSPDPPQILTGRDGLLGDEGIHVSVVPDLVVVSTERSSPRILRGDLLRPESIPGASTRFSDKTIVCAQGGQTMLAFSGLARHHRGVMLGVASLPWVCRVDDVSTLSGEWSRVQGHPWGESWNYYNAYLFCETLSDGRIIVGSLEGLVELQGDDFVWADLVEHPDSWFTAFHEVRLGEYWLAGTGETFEGFSETVGGLLHVKDGVTKVYDFADGEHDRLVLSLTDFGGRVFAGTDNGLFEFDAGSELFHRVSNSHLNYAKVVMFAGTEDRLWAATAKDGVFVMDPSGCVVQMDLAIDGKQPHVNSVAIDHGGQLWVSASEGTMRCTVEGVKPLLLVDTTIGTKTYSESDGAELVCRVGSPVRFQLAARDDHKSVTFQCQVGDQPWVDISTGTANAEYSMTPSLEETIQCHFRCVDSDFNYSEVKTVLFRAAYPFWERPLTRWLIGVLLFVLSCGLVTMFIVNDRTRDRARQAAVQTAKERELLLARVSHDLRNPLSVVAFATDLLKLPNFNSEEIVGFLTSSTSSMSYLTDQLLTYARSFNDDQALISEPVNLAAFVAELKVTANLRYTDSKVEFLTEVAEDCPEVILAPRLPLAEILNNLIDNAFKYTEEGSVTISCRPAGEDALRFCVADTGIGMTPDALGALFKPFVRGAEGAKSQSSVGLGMSICERLVEQVGGAIHVDSQFGKGTEVEVIFPAPVPDADSVPHQALLQNILVVDDEESVRDSLAQYLTSKGHTVIASCDFNLEEALGDFRPAVALVDLAMPVRSGFQVALDLRERFGDSVRIIAMSASPQLCNKADVHHVFDDAVSKGRLAESLQSLLRVEIVRDQVS